MQSLLQSSNSLKSWTGSVVSFRASAGCAKPVFSLCAVVRSREDAENLGIASWSRALMESTRAVLYQVLHHSIFGPETFFCARFVTTLPGTYKKINFKVFGK